MHLLPPRGAAAEGILGAGIGCIGDGKGRPRPIVPVFIRREPAERALARSFHRSISDGHPQCWAEFNSLPQPFEPCESMLSANRQPPVVGRISDHCDKGPAERGIDSGAVHQVRCDLAIVQQRAEEIAGASEFVPTDRRDASERRPDQQPG